MSSMYDPAGAAALCAGMQRSTGRMALHPVDLYDTNEPALFFRLCCLDIDR